MSGFQIDPADFKAGELNEREPLPALRFGERADCTECGGRRTGCGACLFTGKQLTREDMLRLDALDDSAALEESDFFPEID